MKKKNRQIKKKKTNSYNPISFFFTIFFFPNNNRCHKKPIDTHSKRVQHLLKYVLCSGDGKKRSVERDEEKVK